MTNRPNSGWSHGFTTQNLLAIVAAVGMGLAGWLLNNVPSAADVRRIEGSVAELKAGQNLSSQERAVILVQQARIETDIEYIKQALVDYRERIER